MGQQQGDRRGLGTVDNRGASGAPKGRRKADS